LANFAFDCHRVCLRFTRHCNISCRHCYNKSGPHGKGQTIDIGRLLAIVSQMPMAGLRELTLTGGEPLLYRDHVTTVISAARQVGVRAISINTNGFWAATPGQADQMLDSLRSAGFMASGGDALKVSAGAYHQEFIPLTTICVLAERFYRMFDVPIFLDVEVSSETPAFGDQVRRALASAGLDERVQVAERSIVPLGRGQSIATAAVRCGEQPCAVINQIVFDPDGMVRPCCGMNADNHGIAIGRADDQTLREIVKRMQNDPILQILSEQRLDAMFSYVGRQPKVSGYAGDCDLCQDALGALVDKDPLQRRLFSQQRYYPFWFNRSEVQPSTAG
jgi:hypothetical protein